MLPQSSPIKNDREEPLCFEDLPLDYYNKLNYSVYVVSYSWTYMFVNDFARKYLGPRGENLIEKNVWEQFRDPGFAEIEAVLRPNIDERKSFEINALSPLTKKMINIKGFPLQDSYYFSVSTLPEEHVASSKEAQGKPVFKQKSKVCLLVDDDDDDVELFTSGLKEISASATILTASDGLRAIQVLKKSTIIPDVIFLDLNMPRMNGFEFLHYIRSRPTFERIPVIVYTTSNNHKEQERAIALGAVDYITKRSSYTELCTLLKKFF